MIFGGVDIKTHGFVVLKKNGLYDLPSRIAPVFYDWGDTLEPLVLASDISLLAKTFSLDLLYDHRITSSTISQAISFLAGLNDFNLEIDESTGSYGVMNCRILSSSKSENYKGFYKITLVIYNRVPETPGVVPSNSNPVSNYAFGGVNATDFGLTFGKMKNYHGLGESKQSRETVFFKGGKLLSERGFQKITFPCFLVGSSATDALVKLENFKKALVSPGVKELRHFDKVCNVFSSDGLSVKRINSKSYKFDLILNLVP